MNPKSESQYPAIERVKADIAAGDLGKARDRLHGLINSYPDDFILRPILADIYWQMKCPYDAGRFWYFEAERTEEMQKAVDLFIERCRYDPVQILGSLQLRVNLESMPDGFVREEIAKLKDAIRTGGKTVPSSIDARLRYEKKQVAQVDLSKGCKRAGIALSVAFFVFLTLAALGLMWLKERLWR